MKKQRPIFAQNLKYLRDQRNLSQDTFAYDMDITKARVGAYEEGRSDPPYWLLVKIADYFEVTADHMLRKPIQGNCEDPANA